ncbi:MAG: sulfotransferase [Leptospirillia bacterium]
MNRKNDIEALLAQAMRKGGSGDRDGAGVLLERVVSMAPGHPQGLFMLGVVRSEQGRLGESQEFFERAVRAAPNMPDCHFMLGMTLLQQGDTAAAEACFNEVLRLNPEHVGALMNLGLAVRAQGRTEEAILLLSRAVQAAPQVPEAHLYLGMVHEDAEDLTAAARCYEKVLAIQPDNDTAHDRLCEVALIRHQHEKAEYHVKKRMALNPNNLQALFQHGRAIVASQGYEAANAAFEKAAELDPSNPDIRLWRAMMQEKLGHVQEAYDLILPLLDSGDLNSSATGVFGVVSQKLGRGQEAIERIERTLVEDTRMTPALCQALHHVVANLYDRAGDYDQAFAHYREGNRQCAERFDLAAFRARVDNVITVFTRDAVKRLPKPAHHFRQPVFIVGMPRSGTSLTEQIIASHPRADGAGELDALARLAVRMPSEIHSKLAYPDCIADLTWNDADRLAAMYVDILRSRVAGDVERITDKMPVNFFHLGLIAALFPDAPVIHTRRDPMDTCLSCYMQQFGNRQLFTTDLTQLGRYYREYERLMAHWREVLDIRLLEVGYEELVADQESMSRKIIEHVGLPWDDACLNFHENRRVVSTASYDQVRQPIYQSSVARWKRYEKHLGPLIEALEGKE